jgi:hypothetical protein
MQCDHLETVAGRNMDKCKYKDESTNLLDHRCSLRVRVNYDWLPFHVLRGGPALAHKQACVNDARDVTCSSRKAKASQDSSQQLEKPSRTTDAYKAEQDRRCSPSSVSRMLMAKSAGVIHGSQGTV